MHFIHLKQRALVFSEKDNGEFLSRVATNNYLHYTDRTLGKATISSYLRNSNENILYFCLDPETELKRSITQKKVAR